MIPPGATIGIVGGGQLGRMLALAAARLGYRCHIYDPHEAPCAALVSAQFTRGAFDDAEALQRFARDCAVVTYEFENLPVGTLATLGPKLRPGIASLKVAQDRAVEKQFLETTGAAIASWRSINGVADVKDALEYLGAPILLKTRRLGYDGKGQAWVESVEGAGPAWSAIGASPAVAEKRVAFEAEFSVILARGGEGTSIAFPVSRNEHEGGILRRSTVPAGVTIAPLVDQAVGQAKRIADALNHVGVLTVEFFAFQGRALVNEVAPRVHNSGHWTIDGAATSQFEQHLRAILGLPLGRPDLVTNGATMQNLIGDDTSAWPDLMAEPGARLHLYDKGEARTGRKMGHVTRLS